MACAGLCQISVRLSSTRTSCDSGLPTGISFTDDDPGLGDPGYRSGLLFTVWECRRDSFLYRGRKIRGSLAWKRTPAGRNVAARFSRIVRHDIATAGSVRKAGDCGGDCGAVLIGCRQHLSEDGTLNYSAPDQASECILRERGVLLQARRLIRIQDYTSPPSSYGLLSNQKPKLVLQHRPPFVDGHHSATTAQPIFCWLISVEVEARRKRGERYIVGRRTCGSHRV
ncbi:hypothetical protein LX36DRAFT_72311 [Colletotrichum falcatum]|nr:hypothetical protein LX36DRAFT_72311 [Colletotrichum falcatum]